MHRIEHLYESDGIGVVDFVCGVRGVEAAATERARAWEVIFVRSGTFRLTAGAFDALATPNEAIVVPPGTGYAITHPAGGGDASTVLILSEERWEESGFGGSRERRPVRFRATPRASVAQRRVLGAARARVSSTPLLEAEIAAAFESLQPRPQSTVAEPLRRRIGRVQEMVASRFSERLRLGELAREAGMSKFHLARAFRATVGDSIHAYAIRLRLRAALERLGQGERDLAALALDLGFADHSHFTRAFRREFGVPPSRHFAALRDEGG